MERAFLATQVATCLKNSKCPTELELVSDIQIARRYKVPPDFLHYITVKAWSDEPRTSEWVQHALSQAGNIDATLWFEGEFGEPYMGFLVKPVGHHLHAHFVKYVPHTQIPTMSLGTFEFSKDAGVVYHEPSDLRDLVANTAFLDTLASMAMGAVIKLKTEVSRLRLVPSHPHHPLKPPSLGGISVTWHRGKRLLLDYEPA